MNEFFSLQQWDLSLEEYHSRFVTLQKHAPAMTIAQQVAQICQGLNTPLDSHLEAMRPITLQDVLLKAKPIAKESRNGYCLDVDNEK